MPSDATTASWLLGGGVRQFRPWASSSTCSVDSLDADFDLSNPLVTAIGPDELTMDGIDLRNWPRRRGRAAERAPAVRRLDLAAEQVLVWNNSS